jgi:hypothetical protein
MRAWSAARLSGFGRHLAVAAVRCVLASRLALAQAPPSSPSSSSSSSSSSSFSSWLSPDPIALADGRVTIAGDVSASFGSRDAGFFNYTDYDHSALRVLRLNLIAAVKMGDHFSVLGDLQTENLDSIRPYALYLRFRPWTTRDVDVQVGRVPPTFGAFARRSYASDNPLIGYPLAYQYFTSIRPDALPATVDELLQRKGLGWLEHYSVGNPASDHGVPLVNAFRWDTGAQVHAALLEGRVLTVTASVTNGTLSNPLVRDDNGGKQVAGRLEWRPTAALVVGGSAARGAFVSDSAVSAAGYAAAGGNFTQTAWGGDVEYSRDYILLRAETIVSAWRLPFASEPGFRDPLMAVSASVEGRYKINPALYVAGRVDHLGFGTVTGSQGRTPWDAPVTRLEVGGGYSIQRNLLLKASYQHDARDGGRLVTQGNLVATQVVLWF